jgi:uracil-DNA glycosylase
MEKTSTQQKTLRNELDFGSDDESISDKKTPTKKIIDENSKTISIKKFMDEDEESDDETPFVKKNIIKVKTGPQIKPIIGNRPMMDYMFANANNYSFKSWKECFPDKKIKLRSLIFNPTWNDFFDIVEKKTYFTGMERILSDYLEKSNETILPHAELVFNIFNVLSPKQIKVVISGQDPYPGTNKINNKLIPQAMGFSFSVPQNYPKPDSLKNIYENLLQFKHITRIPNSGCLSYWILQGCFMMNAAFTTFYTKKNVHRNVWKCFTDDLLSYINTKCENIVFVVWGKDAHILCQNIDPYKHQIITSSHPSPLAFEKTFSGYAYGKFKNPRDRKVVTYPSFKSTDHFGRINNYLKSVNKREIIWDLIN